VTEAHGAACRAVCEGGSFTTFVLTALPIRESLTSLNLANNSIGPAPSFLLPNNLRGLQLTANPLDGFPRLYGCSNLLALDLGYVTLDWRPEMFAPLVKLRVLKMDGCGLTSLSDPPIFRHIPQLQELGLSENDLQDVAAIEGLRGLSSLLELDLKENGVAQMANYRATVKGLAPMLLVLDNQGLDTQGKAAMAHLSKGMRDAVERNHTLLDEATENEADAALKGYRDHTVIR
jgi:hypothetical protein